MSFKRMMKALSPKSALNIKENGAFSPGAALTKEFFPSLSPSKKYLDPLINPDKYMPEEPVTDDPVVLPDPTDMDARTAALKAEKQAKSRKGRRSTLAGQALVGKQKGVLG